jgi:hypothetical protein
VRDGQPARPVLARPGQQEIDVDAPRAVAAPPAARPSARSTALQASRSSSTPAPHSARRQALRNSRWSGTSPTGSVS